VIHKVSFHRFERFKEKAIELRPDLFFRARGSAAGLCH
jgi:hypothetical protein